MKYELKTSEDGKREYILRDNEDGTFSEIPINPANGDYQAYLNKDKPQVEHLTEIPPQAALSTPIVRGDE